MADFATGTLVLEELAAHVQITGGARLDRSTGPCGEEFSCFTGGWTPKGAITLGHTVTFSRQDLSGSIHLVRHEYQHVLDVESTGGLGFYGAYLGEWAIMSAWHGRDYYSDLYWEQRAHDRQIGTDQRGLGAEIVDPVVNTTKDQLNWTGWF